MPSAVALCEKIQTHLKDIATPEFMKAKTGPGFVIPTRFDRFRAVEPELRAAVEALHAALPELATELAPLRALFDPPTFDEQASRMVDTTALSVDEAIISKNAGVDACAFVESRDGNKWFWRRIAAAEACTWRLMLKPATTVTKAALDEPEAAPAETSAAPAIYFDKDDGRPVVFGHRKNAIGSAARKYLDVMIAVWPKRLTWAELSKQANTNSQENVVTNLRKRDADWAKAIILSTDRGGGGYGLAAGSSVPEKF